MKLVEILARELKEWPCKVKVAVQDNYDCNYKHVWLCSGKTENISRIDDRDGWVIGSGAIIDDYFVSEYLASDRDTAIVTRADWEAERARIAKPAKKPNKDGWIRHRGGKCPVAAGTAIEYRERSGNIEIECEPELLGTMWVHENHPHDIMAYRLHKPAEQPASDSEASGSVTKEMIFGSASQADGPLQWRDRINEINASVEALEEERASLVQRLEDEGFRLIERAVQPVEDMSDPKNWKVGDLIESLNDSAGQFTKGTLYKVKELHQFSVSTDLDDAGSDTNGWGYSNFKFHSRPSK